MRERRVAGIRLWDLFIFIIVASLLILSGLVFGYFQRGESREVREITYSVSLKNLPHEMLGHIHAGDTAIDSVEKKKIGTVTDVTSRESVTEISHTDGYELESSGVMVQMPGRIDIKVTISCQGYIKDGVFVTESGYRLCPGEKVFLRMWDFAGEGTVLSVDG